MYLIFNEGYSGRDELAAEAIWLGRALTELLPGDPEVRGLLAMMLLHDSRRETRFNDGELVLLEDQDPARWNTTQIDRGRAELDRAIALGGRGPYVLQAAIASLHAQTPCDRAQIDALYGELIRLTASPRPAGTRSGEARAQKRMSAHPIPSAPVGEQNVGAVHTGGWLGSGVTTGAGSSRSRL